ncbi:MAG: amidohydrolase family protein, partial [Oscillospiraceae bacterium]
MTKIADCHVHIFPNKLADKAVKSIGNFYDSKMLHNGTADELIESGATANINKYLVSSSATKPEQVSAINDFIHCECELHEEFIGLGTMHPDFEDIDCEIEKIHSYGLKGVKLHPDFQSFNIDDEKAIKMYKKLSEANLPILFHTGDKRYNASSPERMSNAAKAVPNMKCIAAHFGGYNHWYDVLDYLKGLPNVMFDTSST